MTQVFCGLVLPYTSEASWRPVIESDRTIHKQVAAGPQEVPALPVHSVSQTSRTPRRVKS